MALLNPEMAYPFPKYRPHILSKIDVWKSNHFVTASMCFSRRFQIHRWPVNSTHKRPVTWKMFPSDDVISNTIKVAMLLLPSVGSGVVVSLIVLCMLTFLSSLLPKMRTLSINCITPNTVQIKWRLLINSVPYQIFRLLPCLSVINTSKSGTCLIKASLMCRNRLANGRAALIWMLSCHWQKGMARSYCKTKSKSALLILDWHGSHERQWR